MALASSRCRISISVLIWGRSQKKPRTATMRKGTTATRVDWIESILRKGRMVMRSLLGHILSVADRGDESSTIRIAEPVDGDGLLHPLERAGGEDRLLDRRPGPSAGKGFDGYRCAIVTCHAGITGLLAEAFPVDLAEILESFGTVVVVQILGHMDILHGGPRQFDQTLGRGPFRHDNRLRWFQFAH